MEPYAPPPAAGAPPSGRTGGRGSVGLGPVHGLVHVEGVDLQAVYLGGAGEGEVIPVQGDDVGVVIHLLLNVAVHLHALVVVHLRLGGHVEGVQLLVVQAGVEALGLIVVHGPAHDAGGILVVVHPLENGGLVALRAVLVGQGGGLQKLDVAGEAGLVHLGLDEGGNLLIEGGAGADGQGKLHGLGVAGIGQHLLGGVGSVLGHLQIGVAPVALGLGDNGGHRGAVLAGDGAGQLGLVQRVIQGLAHLDIVKGRLRGVDGQTKWGDDRFENKAG